MTKAHIERRTQGKYPAVSYLAVVYKGNLLGSFNTNREHAEIYMAGVNTGLELAADDVRHPVD